MTAATAIAHPNIALAKYWGKCDVALNIPAVPSLSVTLAGMATQTTVRVVESLDADTLELDGQPMVGRPLARASDLLDRVWRGDGLRPRARMTSRNDFPTAAGLASSASAFAALAVAANEVLAAGWSHAELSSIARGVSASSGRSMFGGYVVLPAGERGQSALAAEPLAPAEHWQLRLVVAVTSEAAKATGSTEGMNATAATSPLYAAWLACSDSLYHQVRQAVLQKNFAALGTAAEQSALTMHATALAADPAILYWLPATVAAMRTVRGLRDDGVEAYFTIDAGPHVKVLTLPERVDEVVSALTATEGVLRTIVARPGPGARLVVGAEA